MKQHNFDYLFPGSLLGAKGGKMLHSTRIKCKSQVAKANSIISELVLPGCVLFSFSSDFELDFLWQIAGSTGTSEGKVQDARSWILANHRMPAYRARALAICLSILHPPPSLEDVHDLGEVVTLSDSLVPRLQINTASGQTIPHIPSTSLDQNSGRLPLFLLPGPHLQDCDLQFVSDNDRYFLSTGTEICRYRPASSQRSKIFSLMQFKTSGVIILRPCFPACALDVPEGNDKVGHMQLRQGHSSHVSIFNFSTWVPSTSIRRSHIVTTHRWAWVPYFGQGANSQQKHPMEVLIEGTGLEWLKQGRLHAFHSTWLPVRLKPGLQDPNTKIAKPDAGRNSGRTEWPLGWFSAQKDNALESVEAEAQLPNAVALQV